MIVVDSSVWIEATRRPLGPLPSALRSLLDADEVALALPVRLELTAGIARKDRRAFLQALSALPVLRPSDDTWDLIERWVPSGADKGQRFALADLMIAALAHEIGALVWSLDEDFARLEDLGVVQMYASPGQAERPLKHPAPSPERSRGVQPERRRGRRRRATPTA